MKDKNYLDGDVDNGGGGGEVGDEGISWRTNQWTDIGDCRVAFETENISLT